MKILSMGDGMFTSTGYGTVWNSLLLRWKKLKPDWDFYHCSWQGYDRAHKVEGITVLPRGKADYGYDKVVEYILKYNPDIFITLCDVGWQHGYLGPVYEAKIRGWRGKWVAYTPLDSHKFEKMTWGNAFNGPDVNVAMAYWGEEVMKRNGVKNVVCIPHGVDTSYFKKLNKDSIKAKWGLTNNFVVGFVGRNQKRKMVDRLIRSFADFSKDKNDVKLVLHTDEEPSGQGGWNIQYLGYNYNVLDKILLTKKGMDILDRQSVKPEDINEIYNLMDVFAYPTGGEGFGLPGIECQSAGIPLMMTESSTGIELTMNGKCGFKIPLLKDKYDRPVIEVGLNSVEFCYPDDVALSGMLEALYQDWKNGNKILNSYSKKAIEFSKLYDWDYIAPMWIDLFEKIKR